MMVVCKNMEEALSTAIRAASDTVYAVPGYPVSTLAALCQADLMINEKVALEYALGDSLAGRRSCVIVKHVGMNALVDPLVHATFQGLKRGVVIVCGDDEKAKNTMTAQDSRYFGPVARIPVLEGKGPDDIRAAFAASERFSRVCLLRITPALLSAAPDPTDGVRAEEMERVQDGTLADPDLTMYGRAVRAAEGSALITAAGMAPLPHPALIPSRTPVRRTERGYALSLCASCPYRDLFMVMKERGLACLCDTGCSLIAMNPPFSFGIASYGMGSAVGVAARSTRVALIGDYALLHSGLQALIEVYRKNIPLLCIVMVNRCMGMTGGQPAPDPAPYLAFADPVACDAADRAAMERYLTIPDRPRTLLVYGRCPEVIIHETVAC